MEDLWPRSGFGNFDLLLLLLMLLLRGFLTRYFRNITFSAMLAFPGRYLLVAPHELFPTTVAFFCCCLFPTMAVAECCQFV
jgi:hypothetical protein